MKPALVNLITAFFMLAVLAGAVVYTRNQNGVGFLIKPPAADEQEIKQALEANLQHQFAQAAREHMQAKGQLPPPAAEAFEDDGQSTLSLIRPNEDSSRITSIISSLLTAEREENPPAAQPTEAQARSPKTNQAGEKVFTKKQTPPAPQATVDAPAAASKKQTSQKKAAAPIVPPNTGINWRDNSSTNFIIKAEPQKKGIGTPNLAMRFQTIYQRLRQNITWMMGDKVSVVVYANRASFLHHEKLSGWTGAFFDPAKNRIVMYDEPNNADRMIELFSHELTHLFVDRFFDPKTRAFHTESPVWLNEGLAVNMEDVSITPTGANWADDLIYLNILSASDRRALQQTANAVRKPGQTGDMPVRVPFGTVFFANFADFMDDKSYNRAEAAGDVENWYRQAYAMVRFLFRPYNAPNPEKKMQFQQFTEEINKAAAVPAVNGATFGRVSPAAQMAALKKAYGFKDAADFERKFWQWMQEQRKRALEKKRQGL